MKIALIVSDKLKDQTLLETSLNELGVTEVISGTSYGYSLLEIYLQNHQEVRISKAAKGVKTLQRAYNAIDEAETVLVITHAKGIKTKHAIHYAKEKNKTLRIINFEECA